MAIMPLVLFGLAIQGFAGYAPVFFNLTRDLSTDGITLLLLPTAILLSIAAAIIAAVLFYK